jgi:cysteinyl-tRNA synthetase
MLQSATEYRASPRKISVYSTLGGARVVLDPIDPSPVNPKVLVYVCGLTPQDHAHIGHALMAMRFDIIRRYMMYRRLNVQFMQNVTDIDDKIIAKVLQLGANPLEMTRRFTDEFYQQLAKLHVLPVDRLTKVTEFVPEIIRFIEQLIERGYAYATPEGNVYFDVSKKDDYGKLSNQNVSMLQESVRKELEKDKRSPLDFALWKSDQSTSLSQPSPWGVGRPGWHIECSAMIYETLGSQIDIHGGALDLKFPHHENEIAQSEAHSDGCFARVWMHCGLLNIDGQKMSKSLNNFIVLSEGIERYGVAPLRFAVARSHYRSGVDLTDKLFRDTLHSLLDFHRLFARVSTDYITQSLSDVTDSVARNLIESFEAAMDNDFNTPEALVALEQARNQVTQELDKLPAVPGQLIPDGIRTRVYVMRKLGSILGLFFDSLESVEAQGLAFVGRALGVTPLTLGEVRKVVAERAEARASRDFTRSDELRGYLTAHGVDVLDSKSGSSWRFA